MTASRVRADRAARPSGLRGAAIVVTVGNLRVFASEVQYHGSDGARSSPGARVRSGHSGRQRHDSRRGAGQLSWDPLAAAATSTRGSRTPARRDDRGGEPPARASAIARRTARCRRAGRGRLPLRPRGRARWVPRCRPVLRAQRVPHHEPAREGMGHDSTRLARIVLDPACATSRARAAARPRRDRRVRDHAGRPGRGAAHLDRRSRITRLRRELALHRIRAGLHRPVPASRREPAAAHVVARDRRAVLSGMATHGDARRTDHTWERDPPRAAPPALPPDARGRLHGARCAVVLAHDHPVRSRRRPEPRLLRH